MKSYFRPSKREFGENFQLTCIMPKFISTMRFSYSQYPSLLYKATEIEVVAIATKISEFVIKEEEGKFIGYTISGQGKRNSINNKY